MFTALKWQVQRATRGRHVIYHTEWYPEIEPRLPPDASIALFRVAEEALAMTFKRGSVEVADLQVRLDQNILHMKFYRQWHSNDARRSRAGRGYLVSVHDAPTRLRLLGRQCSISSAPMAAARY